MSRASSFLGAAKKLRLPSHFFAIVAAILAFAATVAQAADYHWIPTTGDWSTPNNWGGIEPTAADNAYIDNGGTAYVTQPGETCKALNLGGTTNSGTIDMSAGSGQLSTGDEYIGYAGNGTFNQSAGTNQIANSLHLSSSLEAIGSYNLSGTGYLSATDEFVGDAGLAAFNQSGGTNIISNSLAVGIGSTYTLSGNGVLSVGTGGISVLGGQFEWLHDGLTSPLIDVYAGQLVLGFDFSLESLLSGKKFHGTVLHLEPGLTYSYGISNNATGTFAGSSNAVMDSLSLGDSKGSGTLNLSGSGTVTVYAGYIGDSGIGTVNQTAGKFATNIEPDAAICVGHGAAALGTYNLSGTGQLTALNEYVGYSGTGIFNHSAGSNTLTNVAQFYLGYNSGSNGSYNLSGTGRLSAVAEYVGCSGTGTFTQSAGTNTVSALYLGSHGDSSGNGTYNLSGAGQVSATSENIGVDGQGTFNQSGGTNTVNTLRIGNYGSYNLTGGTLSASAITHNNGETGVFNFGAGTLQVRSGFSTVQAFTLTGIGGNATIDTGTYSVTFGQRLSGPGGLNKTGSGTLYLSYSDNTFLGDTVISLGAIRLSNIRALQSSTLDYNSYGGTLSFGTLTSATLGGIKGSQALTLNNTSAAAVALTVGANGQSTAYSGALAGLGSLTKVGTGTLILSGSNSYSGTTTVSGGILQAKSTGALPGYDAFVTRVTVNPSGTLAVNAGGTGEWTAPSIQTVLSLAAFNSGSAFGIDTTNAIGGYFVYGNPIIGNFGLTKIGTGTLILSGSNFYSGATKVSEGVLQAKSTSALPGYGTLAKVTANSGGTLAVNAGGTGEWTAPSIQTVLSQAAFNSGSAFGIDTTNTIGGDFAYGNTISGNLGLTKLGTGTLTLTGPLTYTGTTTIDGGSLRIFTPVATQSTVVLHDIVGTGELVVGDGVNDTRLTATSIQVGKLTIGAAHGATQAVPEPSVIVLLVSAIAASQCGRVQWKRRRNELGK